MEQCLRHEGKTPEKIVCRIAVNVIHAREPVVGKIYSGQIEILFSQVLWKATRKPVIMKMN